MDLIVIGGEERAVSLKLMQCNEYIKKYNAVYIMEAAKIQKKYDYLLPKIKEEKDSAEQLRLIDEYIAKCEDERKLIQLPLEMIWEFIWGVLTADEKQRFDGKIENMVNEILIDEVQDLADFVGNKILRLQGYKKKLNMR